MDNFKLSVVDGSPELKVIPDKDKIQIVDLTNQLKAEGKGYKEAIVEASMGRIRPILMTTISMAIGMLPIALGTGTAAAWKNGLAWVIIGGLLSSLVLTVFLVPMVYDVVDTVKLKMKNFKFRKKKVEVQTVKN